MFKILQDNNKFMPPLSIITYLKMYSEIIYFLKNLH